MKLHTFSFPNILKLWLIFASQFIKKETLNCDANIRGMTKQKISLYLVIF